MNTPKGKYIWTARVGEKGQIVIPKQAREVFDINAGDTVLLFGDEEKGIGMVKAEKYAAFASEILQKLKGDDGN